MRPSQKQITPEQLAFAQVHALVRIVDDEADLREALSFVLDMEGWKTVTYGRAEDFFTGDSPSEPGCVVLDVRMPGMSGIEAQHEMRSRGIALPIIFLTGHGDVDMAVGAVQDGAFDFLLKPVDNERFLNSVACAAWASAAAAAGLPGEDSLERLAVKSKAGVVNSPGTRHNPAHAGDGEAPLPAVLPIISGAFEQQFDGGVDEHGLRHRRRIRVAARRFKTKTNDALTHAHLRRGNADAALGMHGVPHIRNELSESGAPEIPNRQCLLHEHGFPKTHDFQNHIGSSSNEIWC